MASQLSPWKIERFVSGGVGFLRLSNGRFGLARGALPGDRVVPVEVAERRKVLHALRWKLIEGGPHRVAPPCPWAADCGGCDWMALARPAELTFKAGLIRDALARIGKLREVPDFSVRSIGSDLGYRWRLRVHLGRGGVGLLTAGSHSIVPVDECVIAKAEINRALRPLRDLTRLEPRLFRKFISVELRTAWAGPPLTLYAASAPAGFTAELETAMQEMGVAQFSRESGNGRDQLQRWPLPGGVELGATPGILTQVNWAVNCELIRAVLAGVRQRGIGSFLDLYCGAGNFALPLAREGLTGMAVESQRAAVRLANDSAKRFGLRGVRFLAASVESFMRNLCRGNQRFDLVFIDPPRSGCRPVLELIAETRPSFVAMCSCDPVTLGRDLGVLAGRGFLLEQLQAFDMFPHTHHVETLAWLRYEPRHSCFA